ncbi:MAG: hypothetical protein RQ885_02985 [Desulfurococcales archaeon]|jgi:hypothetical protein|nr:hypothetical protein [Desulfurococcales archaeon]
MIDFGLCLFLAGSTYSVSKEAEVPGYGADLLVYNVVEAKGIDVGGIIKYSDTSCSGVQRHLASYEAISRFKEMIYGVKAYYC